MYEYTAQVIRVVDGDTLHAEVDLGCDVRIALTIRLARLNAPEMRTPQGPPAKAFTEAWVAAHGSAVILRTIKDRREKYGRYLAEVLSGVGSDALSLNQALLDGGFAVPYP
jgi:endonuclease YncB( thermonuclease family)